MLRIIQSIFPFPQITYSTSMSSAYHLINILINDECFFIEYTSTNLNSSFLDSLFATITQNLNSLLPNTTISLHNIPNTSPSPFSKETISFIYEQEQISIFLTLEFLNYLSNQLSLTFHYKATSLNDLRLELLRFRPYFIPYQTWFDISDQQLKNLFYDMITKNLATPKMFALFFKKIPIQNFSVYFSSSIAAEIQNEFRHLSDNENSILLESIYYIIERNLILYLQDNNTILPTKKIILEENQQTLLKENIPKIDLYKYPNFVELSNTPQFTTILQKIPYKNLVTFVAFSNPSNLPLFRKGFSDKGWEHLLEDQNSSLNIKDSKSCIYFIAKILSQYKQLENLVEKFVKKERDWEFLARECDIRDLLISLDSLPSVKLQGIIQHIYQAYKQRIIIFPNIEKHSIIKAQESICTSIYYLHLIGYLK